eukprot:124438-Rhodomonas_salina.1
MRLPPTSKHRTSLQATPRAMPKHRQFYHRDVTDENVGLWAARIVVWGVEVLRIRCEDASTEIEDRRYLHCSKASNRTPSPNNGSALSRMSRNLSPGHPAKAFASASSPRDGTDAIAQRDEQRTSECPRQCTSVQRT